MRVLIWIPPWAPPGMPLFHLNASRQHLVPQAGLLQQAGFRVHLAAPQALLAQGLGVAAGVRVIPLDLPEATWQEAGPDPSATLYAEPQAPCTQRIAQALAPQLDTAYDLVLLWETPVPFLEVLFPQALIVHQMPGAFARAPFPHTVCFDPQGLFRHGSLHRHAAAIQQAEPHPKDLALAQAFATAARRAIGRLQPFRRDELDPDGRFERLVLLPLQVSSHYNFQVDAGGLDQRELLLQVLDTLPPRTGLVVTQYVSDWLRETPLAGAEGAALAMRHPALIHRPAFDDIPSVSQYLLPCVDEVITVSSSLGLQALAWQKDLRVVGEGFLAPLAGGGAGWKAHCDRLLATMLGRLQPLAAPVLRDPRFLAALLEDMVGRKRQGRTGLDLLPRLCDIDPAYGDRLLAGFKERDAAWQLVRSRAVAPGRLEAVREFAAAMNDPQCRAISLDVFDTLLQRPVERPADVFQWLERSVGMPGLARLREAAEVEARKRLPAGREEITLADIHACLAEDQGLDVATLQRLAQAEIELETRLCTPRRFGQDLWREALASGRPIYLLSDMYLPAATIATLLENAGFTGYTRLLVSSEAGHRKKTGGLYRVLLEQTGLQAVQVLHIGDHAEADIRQAKANGLRALHGPAALEGLRRHARYRAIYPTGQTGLARSLLAGLTAGALFDRPARVNADSHFQGRAFDLGYAGLGPMLAGFALWLGRQAKRDGITRLYFLAREGALLKRVYEQVHANDASAAPATYLYASRRAIRVPALRSREDILALAAQPAATGATMAGLLRERFGLPPESIPPDAQATLDGPGGRSRFATLCTGLAERILAHAAREHAVYTDYLRTQGLADEPTPAIVDLGWHANMQGALGRLLQRPLHGYYYATLESAASWMADHHCHAGYAADYAQDGAHPSAALRHRHLLEYLACHGEPTLLRMASTATGFTPEFREEAGLAERRARIGEIHDGAFAFARDLVHASGPGLASLTIDPLLAERTFADFVQQPSAEDAALLEGLEFEDAVGGVPAKWVVAPAGTREPSVWPAGTQAMTQGKRHPLLLAWEAASRGPLGRLERMVVARLVSGGKLAKYERDRAAFFLDSRSWWARVWYSITS